MLDETAAHILGGGIGGTVGAICTCPLELVKTRFQSSQGFTISGSTSTSVLLRSAQTVAIDSHAVAKCDVAQLPKGISFSPQFCRDFLRRSKIIHCMRDVCRAEGYGALFKGLVPTLVGVLPSRCIYFCAYHKGQQFFQQYFPEGHSAVFMLAAGCGMSLEVKLHREQMKLLASEGITASTITNPIWYIKTRLQLDSRPKSSPLNVWEVIKSTYRENGLRGFYRGISASYIGSIETAIHFVVYEHVKGTLLFWGQRRNRQAAETEGEGEESEDCGQQFRGSQGGSKLSANSDMIVCMAASALSKFVAITVAYPHEVVRTRMRERGNKYRTFVGTFMTVLREETWRGLYRGLGTHYIRQVPNSCIMIGTYEWVVYLLHSCDLVAVRND